MEDEDIVHQQRQGGGWVVVQRTNICEWNKL